jgi:hypothetical protein
MLTPDEILPLLPSIQEEESSWRHHGPHARQPPLHRWCGPCDYHGPARTLLPLTFLPNFLDYLDVDLGFK